MAETHRVFLDANVLFSAAYQENSGLSRLWDRKDLTLITSAYALSEAVANLDTDDQQRRLESLINALETLPTVVQKPDLPVGVNLPAKDKPILQAAIRAPADVLLTGDIRHFGQYYQKTIEDVLIQRPPDLR